MGLRLATTCLLGAVLLAGCGGGSGAARTPEDVVRAWSRALNAGDDERAADLFAPRARVVQAGLVTILATHADAVRWNHGLPCSGRIVALVRRGDTVTATFVLGDRPATACDGPGRRAAAAFTIRRGRIVLWHQLPVAQPEGQDV